MNNLLHHFFGWGITDLISWTIDKIRQMICVLIGWLWHTLMVWQAQIQSTIALMTIFRTPGDIPDICAWMVDSVDINTPEVSDCEFRFEGARENSELCTAMT